MVKEPGTPLVNLATADDVNVGGAPFTWIVTICDAGELFVAASWMKYVPAGSSVEPLYRSVAEPAPGVRLKSVGSADDAVISGAGAPVAVIVKLPATPCVKYAVDALVNVAFVT